MALTILGGPTGLFDAATRDQATARQILALALFGGDKSVAENDTALRKRIVTAENQVAQRPDFTVEANTTAAETASVIELIARGVTFPADIAAAGGVPGQRFIRVITVDCYVTGLAANEGGFLRATGTIQGGATPTVLVTTVQGPSAVAAAGLTATPAIGFVAGAGSLNIQVTSAEAEELNWRLNVFIGKLAKLRPPAT